MQAPVDLPLATLVKRGVGRKRGHPLIWSKRGYVRRWEDALDTFGKPSGFKWERVALDRDAWDAWEDAFVRAGRCGWL